MFAEVAEDRNMGDTGNDQRRFERTNLFLGITEHNQRNTAADLFRANHI